MKPKKRRGATQRSEREAKVAKHVKLPVGLLERIRDRALEGRRSFQAQLILELEQAELARGTT